MRIVETLDLSAFTRDAKAVEGRQGRAVLSVRMVLTLWLYTISVGIGSARPIERLTSSDDTFRRIVGEKRVGRTKLSELRVDYGVALDQLFTDVLASLLPTPACREHSICYSFRMHATTIKVEGDLLQQLLRAKPREQSLSAYVRAVLQEEVQRGEMAEAAEHYAEFLRVHKDERAWLEEWDAADLAIHAKHP